MKNKKDIKKIMVDEDPSYMEEMLKITGEKTVPQIFIDQEHIGGCDEFEAYAKEHLGLFE